MSKERLITLFDAVIAIVITLLVLELPRPKSYHLEAVIELKTDYLAYIITFIFIAFIWMVEHETYQNINRVNNRIIGVTFFQLFMISLLPYFTGYMATYFWHFYPQLFYGILITSIHTSYIYSRYLLKKENMDSVAASSIITINKYVIFDFMVHTASLVLCFYYPPVVSFVCLIMLLLWIWLPINSLQD